MSSDGREFKLVGEYDIDAYQCGLKAGDRVRLRRELTIRDQTGQTSEVHPSSEIWTVLRGSSHDPSVVWLRQANGKRHTWDDTEEIFEWFERIDSHDEEDGSGAV